MNINEMFPSKYLKGTDLTNKVVNVVVEGVSFTDEFDEGRKYILSFRGAKKSLMLNKTNVGILQWLFPDVADTNGWIGKEIQLYTELVSFKGQTGPAVRIRGVNSVLGHGTPPASAGGSDPLGTTASAPIQPGNSQPLGPGEQAAAQATAQGQQSSGQPAPADSGDLHDDVMSDPIPF